MKKWMSALAVLLMAGFGCGEKAFDCRDICTTVQSCLAVNIDVSDCTGRCTNFAAASQAAEVRAEQCNECLDRNVCTAQRSFCANLCDFVIVVPE